MATLVVTLPFVRPLGYGESGRRKEIIADCAYTAATYSSGLSLPGSSLGLANSVESLEIIGVPASDANIYKWDSVNQKIRIYASGTEVTGPLTITIRVRALGW